MYSQTQEPGLTVKYLKPGMLLYGCTENCSQGLRASYEFMASHELLFHRFFKMKWRVVGVCLYLTCSCAWTGTTGTGSQPRSVDMGGPGAHCHALLLPLPCLCCTAHSHQGQGPLISCQALNSTERPPASPASTISQVVPLLELSWQALYDVHQTTNQSPASPGQSHSGRLESRATTLQRLGSLRGVIAPVFRANSNGRLLTTSCDQSSAISCISLLLRTFLAGLGNSSLTPKDR